MWHPRILLRVGRCRSRDFFKDETVESDVGARCATVLALFVEVLDEEAVQLSCDGEKKKNKSSERRYMSISETKSRLRGKEQERLELAGGKK